MVCKSRCKIQVWAIYYHFLENSNLTYGLSERIDLDRTSCLELTVIDDLRVRLVDLEGGSFLVGPLALKSNFRTFGTWNKTGKLHQN